MKKAFTMIELVFVIVVIGILAATIIPRTKTNPLQEAAVQLLSHIRYTQHLAIVNDVYDSSDNEWYKGRWQIVFSTSDFTKNVPAYTIFSDSGAYGGDASESEIALNPENPDQIMTGGYGNAAAIDIRDSGFKGMKKLNLGLSYGVETVAFSGGCRSNWARVAFDYLGRPLQGDHSSMTGPYSAGTKRLLQSDCLITLGNGVETVVITIHPETGYANITF